MVIVDPGERVVLSNLGWVDHGAVWRYDASTGRVDHVGLGDARHLVLQTGAGGLFTAVHHYDGSRLTVTVQSFDRPMAIVAQVVVNGWVARRTGDAEVWAALPQQYVGWLNGDATGAAGYFLVSITPEGAEVARLDWFDGRWYDLMYQSVVAVAAIPQSGELLFGVQRAGHLVLAERSGERRRTVELAQRRGNPVPHVRTTAAEVWAIDYDTLVCLDSSTWDATGVVRLQEAADGRAMFVGDLWMPPSEDVIVVPRPGSGDVVLVDPARLHVDRSVPLGRQPLVAAIAGQQLVARDWKTGEALLGDLG
jgi:hypothetical protein